MLIIHEFWKCLVCGRVHEVIDQEREYGQVDCEICGYSLEFNDYRFETWTEEY